VRDIETHTCRHDVGEYHVSAALRASGAVDLKVDAVRQEIGFLHDASLDEVGRHSLSARGTATGASVDFCGSIGWSIRISLRSAMKL
jgi:hypothetical protein